MQKEYPEKITDRATFEKPMESPLGIKWVIVNGEITLKYGYSVKPNAGKIIRFGGA
jgi:hypothetical protein